MGLVAFRVVCGVSIAAISTFGCMAGDGTEEIDSALSAIQAGQLETGYPAVGMLYGSSPEGEWICTGTLISPSYVLTAAHCTGTNLVFKTGTTWANFVDHAVDQQIKHPTLDQAIMHLTSPIEGVPLLKVNEGAPPAVGTVCRAVGFGDYTANGTTTNGTKRSATEQVQFTGAQEIIVKAVSGLTDGGDSGGPLLCGGLIAATLKGHTALDGPWPERQTAIYRTADAAWIASTIAPVYTELALQNNWTNAPFSTRNASVAIVSGAVQFKGAIATTGANAVAFTLPAEFRPNKNVYVPVDLCGAANGRLFIAPSGVVTVQADGPFSNAQCMTSLEGVSFAPGQNGYFPLSLQNGWTHGPSGTNNATVTESGGIVRFRGGIATTGVHADPFTLSADFRPASTVYVPVTLCNNKKGRLVIRSTGVVTVQAESAFSDAQCMTSLDGAWFAKSSIGFSALSLQNGWTTTPFGTAAPAAQSLSGVVRFRGAIMTTGNNGQAFTLPVGFRPPRFVNVSVDLCGAKKGRLAIATSGVVTVQALSSFSDAQCFTSLDGVAFTLSDFTPLNLENGWVNAPWSSARPGFAVRSGVVQLKGGMRTSGTSTRVFTLPPAARPPVDVHLPVGLCDAAKGRLLIKSNGVATVKADGPFSKAACFTSLEGASYALSTSSFTALTLQNGWTNAPFSTRNAAAKDIDGIIHLAGAIANGSNSVVFTLPSGFRPSSNVFVPVDLCDGSKGRLAIDPGGATTIQVNGSDFSKAQCFTSLEGVSFAKSAASFTSLVLVNGWTSAPFGTRSPALFNDRGIVRLQGAIASGLNTTAFTVPFEMRPLKTMYVPADLCGAAKGRVQIDSSGNVTVLNGEKTFSETAQCFTSLEGVSYALGN